MFMYINIIGNDKFNVKRNINKYKNGNLINNGVIQSTYHLPRTISKQPNKDAKI